METEWKGTTTSDNPIDTGTTTTTTTTKVEAEQVCTLQQQKEEGQRKKIDILKLYMIEPQTQSFDCVLKIGGLERAGLEGVPR